MSINNDLPAGDRIPLVSVIIGTYQHAQFIAECINSVLKQQTTFPVEIIIGEDESNDGTREICMAYEKKYPDKIRLFLRSRKNVITINGNPTGRYNFIENMKAARGKYTAILDGDDYWSDPLKLQKQVDLLEKNPGIVACHHWQKVATLNEEGKYEEKRAPTNGHGYLADPVASVQAVFENRLRLKSRTIIFRNVFLEGFQLPDWFYKVQFGDVPLMMLLGKFGNFAFLDEEMAVYRLTGKGASTKGAENPLFTFNHFIEWIRIWEYGLMYYNFQFKKEALTTIYSFYDVIFRKYNYSFKIFWKMMRYGLLKSQFGFFLSLRISGRLVISFLSAGLNGKK